MSLRNFLGLSLFACVTLAIAAPARAEESRPKQVIDLVRVFDRHVLDPQGLDQRWPLHHVLENRGVVAPVAREQVAREQVAREQVAREQASTDGLSTSACSSMFPIDLGHLRDAVADLADEAVDGLMSATIHLPFEIRITPAAAVSWVKGLFGVEGEELRSGLAARPLNPLHAVSPVELELHPWSTPHFAWMNDLDHAVRVKAVLQLDDEHFWKDDRELRELSPSSFELWLPARRAQPRARSEASVLCRVSCAG